MSCTSVHIAAEVRELPPSNGWRQVESVGASFACSCGATGRGPSAEVSALAAPHVRRVGEVAGRA